MELFNFYLTDMRQSGLVQRIINRYLQEKNPPDCSTVSGSSSYKPIEWENIFSAFVMLGGGVLWAGLALYAEIIYLRRRRRQRIKDGTVGHI